MAGCTPSSELALLEAKNPRRVQNRRPTPQDLLELSSKCVQRGATSADTGRQRLFFCLLG
jgi:hypothetical protein